MPWLSHAYSIVLGLIALMGYMAHAAGIKVANPQDAIPQLFLKMFPDWFAGFCFAAIAIGALVPAAVMSIGAANTFTRNIWRPFVHPNMSPMEESVLAKLVSLIVKVGALGVIFFMPTKFALDLQLLGGVWMMQIFPAVVFGLYTRWFSGSALLGGWIVGFVIGTWLSWGSAAWTPTFVIGGYGVYNGITAFVANGRRLRAAVLRAASGVGQIRCDRRSGFRRYRQDLTRSASGSTKENAGRRARHFCVLLGRHNSDVGTRRIPPPLANAHRDHGDENDGAADECG